MRTIAFEKTASQQSVAEAKENDERVKGEILNGYFKTGVSVKKSAE